MRENKILSKTFVLGEYAVLEGGPAILLVSPPVFRLEIKEEPSASCPFHPSSPAGLLWKTEPELQKKTYSFHDPHKGRGGFGGSGAEFVSLFLELHKGTSPETLAWKCWERFRELAPGPGSGVDILVQCFSALAEKPMLLFVNFEYRTIEVLPFPSDANFYCIRTGVKVPTHEHLKEVKTIPVKELSSLVKQGKNALKEDNAAALGKILEQYGAVLDQHSLLASHSKESLEALRKIPGIFGLKACGALGADVLLALTPEKVFASLKSVCEKRNLEIVPIL